MSYITIEFFPTPLLAAILLLAVLLFQQWCQKHRVIDLIYFILFYLYLLLVVNILFFPIYLSQDWPSNITGQQTILTLSHINLIPFNFGDLFSSNPTTIFEQMAGNILLTMPFGFLLPNLTPLSSKRMLWTAAFTGLALEAAQLAFGLLGIMAGRGHSIDINDTILNAVGVVVGYGIFRVLRWMLLGLRKRNPSRTVNE